MRKALKAVIKTVLPVYDLATAITKVAKPYAFLKFGTSINTSMGSFTTFTVTVYVKPDDMLTLDTKCEAVIKALHKVRITRSDGSVFIPKFTGETDDFPDAELSALGKPLHFQIPKFGNDYM